MGPCALAGTQTTSRREGRRIVWGDEAACSRLAGVVRTDAPRGQTPVVYVPLTRDHRSVISGITEQGQVLVQMQARAFKGADGVRFLTHVLCHSGSKLLIIWDGAPIHRDQAVKPFLAAGAVRQIRLEQLPGYAPDLNPDAGVWNYLKQVELRNVSCHDQDELRHEVRLARARLRHKPDIIRGFIMQCGY